MPNKQVFVEKKVGVWHTSYDDIQYLCKVKEVCRAQCGMSNGKRNENKAE